MNPGYIDTVNSDNVTDILIFVAAVTACLAPLVYFATRKNICPMCHTRALKCVQSWKAPSPNWSHHQCEACGARYKQESNPRGPWISVSDEEWREAIHQFPDTWRDGKQVCTGLGALNVWRSEDHSWLRLRPVEKIRKPALIYWSLAANGENIVSPGARIVGMLHGTDTIQMKLPATGGFLTIWSDSDQKVAASFALADLP